MSLQKDNLQLRGGGGGGGGRIKCGTTCSS